MQTFQEWLERSKRYRQDVLGLPSSDDDILSHVWVIETTARASWDISAEYARAHHRFSAAYVIFVIRDQGVYFVTYKQAQGFISAPLLKPIGTIDYLVFPWEVSASAVTARWKTSCAYRVTWLHDLAPTTRQTDEVSMANVEKRLRARYISELDVADAASRGFCDLLFSLCHEYPHLGKKRAELEQLCFWDATSRLTEKATLRWLRDNGMDLTRHWVPCTTRDVQAFLERFPDDVETPYELPSGCFELPYEDAPSEMPIYAPNGTCHLTYRDMPGWAWKHYERFKENLKRIPKDDLMSSDARLGKFFLGSWRVSASHEKNFVF